MDGNGQNQNDPRRATAFTKDTAAVAGSRGGKASARARKEKKIIRELAQDILDCKVSDDALNERMKAIGIISSKGRATVAQAILGGMAERAMTDTGDAVTLLQIASGQIGSPPPTLRIEGEGSVGGVVVMPAPDPSLLGATSGDADSQTSAGGGA